MPYKFNNTEVHLYENLRSRLENLLCVNSKKYTGMRFLSHIRSLPLCVTLALLPTCTWAEVPGFYPGQFWGHSTYELGGLNFDCEKKNKKQISCQFEYEAIRPGNALSIFPDVTLYMRRQPTKTLAELTKKETQRAICGKRKFTVQDRRRREYEERAKVSNPRGLSKNQIEQILEIAEVTVNYCNATEKAIEAAANALAAAWVKKERNACSIVRWKDKFALSHVSLGRGKRPMWVKEGKPYSPCGLKDVTKIIPVPLKEGEWKVTFDYIVLNPDALDSEGRSCKRYQSLAHAVEPGPEDTYLPCDEIKLLKQPGLSLKSDPPFRK